jgi:hypothetical protein
MGHSVEVSKISAEAWVDEVRGEVGSLHWVARIEPVEDGLLFSLSDEEHQRALHVGKLHPSSRSPLRLGVWKRLMDHQDFRVFVGCVDDRVTAAECRRADRIERPKIHWTPHSGTGIMVLDVSRYEMLGLLDDDEIELVAYPSQPPVHGSRTTE